jgi:hypothetical protein
MRVRIALTESLGLLISCDTKIANNGMAKAKEPVSRDMSGRLNLALTGSSGFHISCDTKIENDGMAKASESVKRGRGRPPKDGQSAMSNAERQRQRRARINTMIARANGSPPREALSIAHGISGYALLMVKIVDRGKPKDKVDINEVRRYVDALVVSMQELMAILSAADPEDRLIIATLKMLDEASREAIARRKR